MNAPQPRVDFKQRLAEALRQHQAGRNSEAEALCREVLAADRENPFALHLLGLIAAQAGKIDHAIVLLRQAVRSKPDYAEAHHNLGRFLQDHGRSDEAVVSYRRAIWLRPDYAKAYANLGSALRASKQLAEAEATYRQLLKIWPMDSAAHNNLGVILRELERHDEAMSAYKRATQLQSTNAEAHNNLGTALQHGGMSAEGEACFRRAIALRPNFAAAHDNLGIALRAQGRWEEGIAAHRQALAIDPNYADARYNLGVASLAHGDLATGWQYYEAGWGVEGGRGTRRPFPHERWSGVELPQRALLLWGEQGVGDHILYAGMLGEARNRVGTCIVETEPRLVPLFARSFPNVEVIPAIDPPHPKTLDADIAAQLPLGSLPGYFRPSFDQFPRHGGYLTAEPERTAALKGRYRALGPGPVVGVSWRSNRKGFVRWKSSSLLDWAPILTVPGIVFVNLQYGDCAADLAAVKEKLGVAVHHGAEIDSLKDLDGFAAQVAAMDLVISVSNTAVHFAGALNVPVWTMLPAGLGLLWYWFAD
ncbi:MAG: tetratricopeptide repeat protein, partial [Proteobacteria bacterium]|nr:tetratricopeptide repeat protein [Pseudomonadota bacterium]